MALPKAGNRRKGKQKKAPPHVFVLKQLRRDGGNFGKLASLFFFRGKSKARQDGRVQPSSSVFSIPLPPEALDPSQHKSRSLRVVAPPGGLEKIERCFLLFQIRSLFYSESERPRRCKSLFSLVYCMVVGARVFFSRLSPIPTTTT